MAPAEFGKDIENLSFVSCSFGIRQSAFGIS